MLHIILLVLIVLFLFGAVGGYPGVGWYGGNWGLGYAPSGVSVIVVIVLLLLLFH